MRSVVALLIATALACLACGDDSISPADASADSTFDSTLDAESSTVDANADADAASDASSCSSACDASLPVCLDGTCVACAPGATTCDVADSGTTARTCNGAGAWQVATCVQPSPDCDAGTCECAGAVCNGTCIDVSSDSANCGRCGHDCCGGACVGGQCQAVTVANNQLGTSGIAVDATDIYWTAYSQVMKCSKTNCTTPTTLFTYQSYPSIRIVLDASNAYSLTTDGAIRSCPKSGCTSPTVLWSPTSSQNLNVGTALVLDAGALYWTYNDKIFKCATTGCGGDGGAPGVLVSGQTTPSYIATDSTSMFWGAPFPTNAIEQCALGGCGSAPTTFTNAPRPDEILVDATNVYWISDQTGALMSCSKTTCITPSVVTFGTTSGLGQDDTYLYWTTNSLPYQIYACPKSGKCTLPLLVATVGGSPPYSSIVTDDACIYFGAQTQVMKAAKP